MGEVGAAGVERPSCGPHCHAVAGAGAQVSEGVTPGIPTQHHAPNTTAGGCVIDIHHIAFCSSPRCCPGGLQRRGRGAAQGEVGRGQGIWKARGRQSAPACHHLLLSAMSWLLCPVVPCALAVLDSSPQLPVGRMATRESPREKHGDKWAGSTCGSDLSIPRVCSWTWQGDIQSL